MKVILYSSKTGYTKEYVDMLSKELNLKSYNIKEINKINKNDEVIFMSYIIANTLKGVNKVKSLNVICYVAVGINNESEGNTLNIKKINNIKKPLFYLQGGVNYNELKGIRKTIFNIGASEIVKNSKDEKLKNVLKNGGSFVNKNNLKEILKFIEKGDFNEVC